MTIRTFEFVYHANKHILDRNIIISIKKISLILIETIIIVFISNNLPYLDNISYLNWFINALMTGVVASLICIFINFVFYKEEFKELFNIIKNIIKNKKQ